MSATGRHRRSRGVQGPRALRLTCAAGLVVTGVAALLLAASYRSAEARTSAWLGSLVSERPIWTPSGDQAVILVGRPVDLAFVITPSCSSLVVSVIFLFGSALLAVFAPRFRLSRIVSAFCVAVPLALGVNVARVALIILASSTWNYGVAFELSHEYIGSVLTLFGMAVALFVYVAMLARDRSSVSTA